MITAQILVALKSKDPTALTAEEAIRHLLGFDDRLVEIRRRHLHELVLRDEVKASEPLSARLGLYLHETFVFWNPNKQRAWVRLMTEARVSERPWESAAGTMRAGSFGTPDLDDAAYDHLLLWPRGPGGPPGDLASRLAPWEILAYGRGELYSLRWRAESSAEERKGWTTAVAVARSRHEGLLVNPHFQDHRIFSGAVPLPLWAGF